MIPCPQCAQPMEPTHKNHTLRIFCSRKCSGSVLRAPKTEVDPISVYRLIHGFPPAVTNKPERIQATAYLTARGYNLKQIAERLHTTPRSISRYRRLIKEAI